MFKKLRIMFIALNMTMVAVVLIGAFTAVVFVEYQRDLDSVQTAMVDSIKRTANAHEGYSPVDANAPDNEAQNTQQNQDGALTDETASPDTGSTTTDGTSDSGTGDDAAASTDSNAQDSYNSTSGNASVKIGGGKQDGNKFTPVAVYYIGDDGSVTVANDVTTAVISEETLATALAEIDTTTDCSGTLNDVGLHYVCMSVNSMRYVAFADTASTSNWQSLAVNLAITGVVVLIIFFIISLFFSKWALKPVREAWDAQRQFVADASHELKTPLTVILANTSILLKHPERTIASQSQWVESTQVEANNMQGLVSEMLELAEVEETTKKTASFSSVDLSDLVDGEALQFESVAFERNCTLQSDIEEGVKVEGDPTRLQKVVSTLIENALKYVDDNGTVYVKLTHEGKHALFSVRNTGSYVEPKDQPHIFDRFYRTDKARTSGTGGYGLGLAIARETVQTHGGEITCTSSETEGTTFTVSLPLEN